MLKVWLKNVADFTGEISPGTSRNYFWIYSWSIANGGNSDAVVSVVSPPYDSASSPCRAPNHKLNACLIVVLIPMPEA